MKLTYEKAVKFLKLAHANAAIFSKDPSTKVAAMALNPRDLSVLATGVNGFPAGWKGDKEETWNDRPKKYKWVVHAERNLIAMSARNGIALQDTILVVTLMPCVGCATTIAQAGIKMIICPDPDLDCPRWGQDFRESKEMFEDLGIELMFVDRKDLVSMPE